MVAKFWGMFSSGSQDISCQKFQQMASEYLDGTLGSRMLWRFSYHAERCGGCSGFVSSLRATINVLRSLPSQTAPEELKRRILEQYSPDSGETGMSK